MEITCLTVGDLATNCYLVTDEETRETIIIDPADEGDFISTTILEKKFIPKAIILTHGHYDHCLAVLELKLNFELPIYLHPKDLFLYEKAHLSAKRFSHISIPKLPKVDHLLGDGNLITFGSSTLKVIHTPGHTPGSICLLSIPVIASFGIPNRGNLTPPTSILFTGDTLFESGSGSTDHSYSSPLDLQKSLKKISDIWDSSSSIRIFPGHENYDVELCLLTGK